MMNVVLTGAAFDRTGRSILRADLIAACKEKQINVQTRVDAKTHVLVASREDTVKAKNAAKRGIGVMDYPTFIKTFLGDEVAETGAEPNVFTDDAPSAVPEAKDAAAFQTKVEAIDKL